MTRIPILLYHSISEESGGPLGDYTTAPGDFRGHMNALLDAGYAPISLAQAVAAFSDAPAAARSVLPERPFVLTFDDGLADFVTHAHPVLVDLGLTATMFVSTAATWRDRPLALGGRLAMSREQVAGLPGAGIDVGSHSHEHLQLDLVSPRRAADEIRRSKDLLEDCTGTSVRSFAYPHGYHRRDLRRTVARLGFEHACGVRDQVSHTGDDRWALARLMVRSSHASPDDLLGMLDLPTGHRPGPVRGAARLGWRGVRLLRTRGRPVLGVAPA